jgi:putative addiction module component (TIGR02574 family)
MTRFASLLSEMMELPNDERAKMDLLLLDSLESGEEAEIAKIWDAEVRQRLADLDAGKVEAAPWSEVRKRFEDLGKPNVNPGVK